MTQAFNTTTSMGRLTLNVLLSFAQFEREVTGERIRDKIAASKKKGMWMGGTLPLGYDRPATGTRTLLVNQGEAATVRHIFASYLAHTSVHALERQLQQEGVVSKRRVTANGKANGGLPFSRGALFHLLRNRLYLGEIPHREICHPGLHEAIIDRALFDTVQQKLDAHVRRRGKAREIVAHAPLTGRIFDADDQVMSPAFAYGRGGKLYRYYVTASLQQGGRRAKGDEAPRRVSAAALEARLLAILGRLLAEHSGLTLLLITRVELHATSLELLLPIRWLARMRPRLLPGEIADADPADPSHLRLSLSVRLRTRGGRTEIIGGAPAASKPDPVLIKALRAAHGLLPTDRTGTPCLEAAPESSYQRRLIRLAFLAPDVQAAILKGQQAPWLTLPALMAEDLPLSWAGQRRLFGAPTLQAPVPARIHALMQSPVISGKSPVTTANSPL